jgi:hypothetical protein
MNSFGPALLANIERESMPYSTYDGELVLFRVTHVTVIWEGSAGKKTGEQ